MNLLQCLLKTYDNALSAGIVDQTKSDKLPNILPIYHSNKKSSGADVIEITINKSGIFYNCRYLNKDTYITFPVSEDSIKRSGSTIAPHRIFDEFAYLVDSMQQCNKASKYSVYMKNLQDIEVFERNNCNKDFEAICKYLKQGSLRNDVAMWLLKENQCTAYHFEKDDTLVLEDIRDNVKKEIKIPLSKIFITFAILYDSSPVSLSQDKRFHEFFIQYEQHSQKNKKKDFCDVSGKEMYCVNSHRGFLGTAKLVSISNHKEAYYGRLKTGDEVFHVGYETSQKTHNMLKFLLDADGYKKLIGKSTYVLAWDMNEIESSKIGLIGNSCHEDPLIDDEYDEAVERSIDDVLGKGRSKSITSFLAGRMYTNDELQDERFCVLILEKVNNGRIAIKFFRIYAFSDIKKRVYFWFNSLCWPRWSKHKNGLEMFAPSIFQIVNYLYGDDTTKGLYISSNKEGVQHLAIERLLRILLEGLVFPKDLVQLAFYKIYNRQSYKYHWQVALKIACILVKKYNYDHQKMITDKEGNIILMKSRSFLYGRLLAIYDKLESDAMYSKSKNDQSDLDGNTSRPTLASRLWSAMINQPLKIAAELERRTKVYQQILTKNSPGLKVMYDKLLSEIYNDIRSFEDNKIDKQSVNEEFVLGYYYQHEKFYVKRSNDK